MGKYSKKQVEILRFTVWCLLRTIMGKKNLFGIINI